MTDIHERRTKQVTEATEHDYPETTVLGHRMDAGDRSSIDSVVEEVTRSLGPIQILINNAAINVVGSIWDCDPETWDWILQVNLSGPWYLAPR